MEMNKNSLVPTRMNELIKNINIKQILKSDLDKFMIIAIQLSRTTYYLLSICLISD